MRNAVSLIVVLAAFAAGGVLGYMLKDDGGAGGRVMRTVVERPAEAAPKLDREDSRSLRDYLETMPTDPVPSGNGRLTGHVKTRDGKPLSGVEVVATPMRKRRWPKRSRALARRPESNLVESVQNIVGYTRWARDGARVATSADDGSYAVEGLGDVDYSIQAFRSGYSLRPQGRGQFRAGATVDIEARAIVRIDMDVVMEGGAAPEKATINLSQRRGNGTSSSSQQWTPADPWIELDPGRFEIHASLSGDLGGKSEAQAVTVKEGDADVRLHFTIKMKPALRLKLEIPEALSPTYVQGWLLRAAGERVPSATDLSESGTRQSVHRGERVILWKDLKPGRYLVGAAFGSFQRPTATALIEVSSGLTEHVLAMPEPSGEGVLKVRLLNPEGKPAGTVQWSVEHRKGGSSRSGGQGSLMRADGVHILMDSHAGDFEGGTHTLYATSSEWGVLTTRFDPKSSAIIEMRFAKPAEVSGQITGYAGSGYEGKVRFQWEDPSNRPAHVWFHGASRIDDGGKLDMEPQQPGVRILALYIKAGRHGWSSLAEQTVSLRPGKQGVSIAMPALHSLRIVWTGDGKPQIALQPVLKPGGRKIHSASYQRKVGEDGVATFDALVAGRYTVVVYGKPMRGKSPQVDIPAQSEIRVP